MRDSTSSHRFLKRKQLERHLMNQFPDKYLSQYQMVTFSTIPYDTALKRGDLQTNFAESLLDDYPDSASWSDPKFLEKVEKWLSLAH